jgi:hypothetical protein
MAAKVARTLKQQEEMDLIKVQRQALVDKNEVLNAIDTRMSKLGADHDMLLHICDLVEANDKKVTNLSIILVGEHGDNGLVEKVRKTDGKLKYIWIVGAAIISAITYLVILHIHV